MNNEQVDFLTTIDELIPRDRNDTEQMKVYILDLCRKYLHGVWESVELDDFIIYKPNGGVSNYLFKCQITNKNLKSIGHEPTQIFVRIYSENHHKNVPYMVNDILVSSMMSSSEIGPKIYGIFPCGRLEELIEAASVTTSSMFDKEISSRIAVELAKFHSLEMPFNKKPCFLYNRVKGYIKQAENIELNDSYKQSDIDSYHKLMSFNLGQEFQQLWKVLESLNSPAVFSHNDCNPGNILDIQNKKLMLIDYEYSGYNYRGFDIGNHFCEWMFNLTDNESDPYYFYNYERYPSEVEQDRFAEAYIEQMKKANGKIDPSLLDKKKLLNEANNFALASHLYWAIWSIASWSPDISFNYWQYAFDRCDGYFKQKKILYPNGF